MARELARLGCGVVATDLVEYHSPLCQVWTGINFLEAPKQNVQGVVTNPPYGKNMAQKFVERSLDLGYGFTAMLCRTNFAESRERLPMFLKRPPAEVHIFSRRFSCTEWHFGKNTGKWNEDEYMPGPEGWENDPEAMNDPYAGMVSFAWWVWRASSHQVPTTMHWIDSETMYANWKASFNGGKYAASYDR